MKSTRALAALCLVAAVILACANTHSYAKQNIPFDTDKWVGDWVKMWNTYDLNQVDRLFVADQRLTYLSSEKEGTLQGIKALREHHRVFGFVAGGKDQPNKLWVDSLVSTDLGDSAVVAGIWYFQRPDGSVQWGPMTMVYLLVGEEYRIVHMHFANYAEKE